MLRSLLAFDFDHYCSLVEPGGFIVFDDYDNASWPGVGEFVDREVRPREDLIFLGSSWHTAVFQVVRETVVNKAQKIEAQ